MLSHSGQRLVEFDIRTIKMDTDWYIRFAEDFRNGSFLSGKNTRNIYGGVARTGLGWSKNKKDDKTWKSLGAGAARFLHWVGFDPSSALPPPDKSTTDALAFLAHDALGRIVEGSLMIMLEEEARAGAEIFQLRGGMQIRREHVLAALKQPGLAKVIYRGKLPESSTTSQGSSRQPTGTTLYFGPGCEERMEMELDSMGDASMTHTGPSPSRDTQEEAIVVKEEELFKNLPPAIQNLTPGTKEYQFYDQRRDKTFGKVRDPRVKPTVKLDKDYKAFQKRKYCIIKCGGKILNLEDKAGGHRYLMAITGSKYIGSTAWSNKNKNRLKSVVWKDGKTGKVVKWEENGAKDIIFFVRWEDEKGTNNENSDSKKNNDEEQGQGQGGGEFKNVASDNRVNGVSCVNDEALKGNKDKGDGNGEAGKVASEDEPSLEAFAGPEIDRMASARLIQSNVGMMVKKQNGTVGKVVSAILERSEGTSGISWAYMVYFPADQRGLNTDFTRISDEKLTKLNSSVADKLMISFEKLAKDKYFERAKRAEENERAKMLKNDTSPRAIKIRADKEKERRANIKELAKRRKERREKAKMEKVVKKGDVICVTWAGDGSYKCVALEDRKRDKNMVNVKSANDKFEGDFLVDLKKDTWWFDGT